MSSELLEVKNLTVEYELKDSTIKAVSNASFSIEANEYFGVVGESGCGKSTLAKSILGGLDNNGRISSGSIVYKGRDIQHYSEGELNDEIRWKEISYIPQSAMNCLDPIMRVSDQAIEIANVHTNWSKTKTLDRLKDLFDIVGLSQSRIDDYPHQMSGGMQQRVVIALSLLLNPSLIIADEPTTALDVIMQDQILFHLDEIKEYTDVSMMLITHDISVVFETCDTILVMHGGQVAENASVQTIKDDPRHPYSIMLQRAFPDIRFPNRELEVIEGKPPEVEGNLDYCTFKDRCPLVIDKCRHEEPPLTQYGDSSLHHVACFRQDDVSSLKNTSTKNSQIN